MASKEKIYAQKVEGSDNIIVVDPNGVMDNNGDVVNRYIAHEDLMIYVEVRAQLNPKSRVFNNADGTTTINVATGKFYDSTQKRLITLPDAITNEDTNHFTTSWTTMYDDNRSSDVEGFGIQSIDIEINASLLPKVHIEFIDVRGKNLMERGLSKVNPYNVFYTFPYPIFELTVKGYLGKSIKMPLLMEKAISRFDPSTGSYIISADFKSWTFAILNDLPLIYAFIAPYMYPIQNSKFQYLGQQILAQKYLDYASECPTDQITLTELGYSDEVSQIELKDLFHLQEKVGQVLKDAGMVSTSERRAAIGDYLESIRTFRDITRETGTTIGQMRTLVVATNIRFTSISNIIKNLVPDGTLVFETKLDPDTYTNKDDANKVFPMTDAEYNSIVDPILAFENTQSTAQLETIKSSLIDTLHFYPSIKNVVKSIVLHFDTFMEILRLKSQAILDGIKSDTTPTLGDAKYDIIEVSSQKYYRMPWPEFNKVLQKGNDRTDTLSWPGDGTEEQREWLEVDFVNEIYNATRRLNEDVSHNWSADQPPEEVFIITPLSQPIDSANLTLSDNDIVETMNHIFQQILDMIFHNGLLYKNVDTAKLFGDGIYDILIHNMFIPIIKQLKDNQSNGFKILNTLRGQVSKITTVALLNDFITGSTSFDDADSAASTITNNLYYLEPSHYTSLESFTTGDTSGTRFDVFKKFYETDNGKTIGVSQLPYDNSWLQLLDIYNFNLLTTVNEKQGVPAIFTNNYNETDDMFITRLPEL